MDVLIVRVCVGVLIDESCFCLVKIIQIIKDTSKTTCKTSGRDTGRYSNITYGCVDWACVCWCIGRYIMFLSGENHKNYKRNIEKYSKESKTAHGGDQIDNNWISRSIGIPDRSVEWQGLRLIHWKRDWNFGDSRENVFDMYGDSVKIC